MTSSEPKTATDMKKGLFLLFLGLALGHDGWAQRRRGDVWNVGLRLGEPFAVNFRSYLSERRALDINVGMNGAFIGRQRNYGKDGRFRRPGVAIGATVLNHFGFNAEGNLRGYYGLGGQINSRRSFPERLSGEYEKKVTLGAVATGGAEYIVVGTPYALFAEVGLYAEAIPVFLFLQPQVGLGVRVKIL